MALPEKLTNAILDSIGEGLFTVDKNFKINYFSLAAEKITGLKRDDVIGRFCKYIFKSELCYKNCPIAQVLESGKNLYDVESEIKNENGTPVPIKLNAAVLRNAEGEPEGGVISFRDLSDLELMKKKLIEKSDFYGVVGHSKAMHEIFQLIEEISESDAMVLLQGESGTGKEMIANAIQETSLRKDQPFVKVNCSVFSDQLLASELFGHVKGAFTGAIKDRPGRFEVANNGTLFLDEVAEMPLPMQLKLLRVLQEGTFERVGESVTRRVDVRVIAATNKDLKKALKEGTFREDLYYRLNVIPIEVPPLRARPEDIPHLVKHFISKFSLIYKKDIQDIEDQALDLILRYDWPGNIRELENAIEYAFARTRDNNSIESCKLPPTIRQDISCYDKQPTQLVQQDEDSRLVQLLEKYHWNKTRVAKELGIGRSTLWRKLKKMEVESK
jgi:PAS domain S-box-containing protein